MTVFRWPEALGANSVRVVGTFNAWQTPGFPLHRCEGKGDFVTCLPLPVGPHQYKFVVDGQWRTSPCEPVVADGQGQFNNQKVVARNCTFVWEKNDIHPWQEPDDVFITGSFAGWKVLMPVKYIAAVEKYYLKCCLPPGEYFYKFLVNGQWMNAPYDEEGHDEDGEICNKITVTDTPTFRVFYATGWEGAVMRMRYVTRSGQAIEPGWQVVPMVDAPSRASPSGGSWKMVVLPAPYISDDPPSDDGEPEDADELYSDGLGPMRGSRSGFRRRGEEVYLEFVVSDGSEQVDMPHGGGSYRVTQPGGYKLQHGKLRPFSRANDPPIMLVSDLDGTMVSEGVEADASTATFTRYWEDHAALAGSILVYNTGRSLGQFMYLWREKNGALALPDVLITAVGTKVWLLDEESAGRGRANGLKWKEDLNWAARLDEGWDLGAVKRVANKVIARHEGQCHWLDQGTEHPHRIALSCHIDVVDAVTRTLQQGFVQAGCQVRIITSGTGDYRYVDCVSQQAGKLEALEYVRSLYGVPRSRCVAAGDSGNDILMLQGSNPAIVVGNAQPELVNWLSQQPQFDHRIMYTDNHLAHGILEGLARHGLY